MPVHLLRSAVALAGLVALVVAMDGRPAAQAGVTPGTAPSARISEEVRVLDTYAFSEPNPVPILTRDPRLYPYHAFEGYEAASSPREWTVVHLENDLIEVWVLPEVGGKVWGARVKATGHEFIYRNEVVKFRNIALRGPWTSGGIEFNFGVIGHTPATATPVDYLLRENPDGSVSCVVGTMDLPSRTEWRVEIRLPADKAYFETRVLWHNPTPLEQPYYNWMTAAAFATDDLVMTIPGGTYLQHSGAPEDWPVDPAGRNLARYAENAFGGNKSFHVVGELNDFFGGYYQDAGYGFGHWARYEDMPGQKLWVWALSRAGGIWEDLLTDTDGQYVEFQAGRLFVQYSPGADVNPITQAAFDPLATDRWTETWFPLEGLGGLTDASREGAMSVREQGSTLVIGVHAFGRTSDTLRVWVGERLVFDQAVELAPLEPFTVRVDRPAGAPYRVALPALDLGYDSDPSARRLSRPFDTDPAARPSLPRADRLAFEGRELVRARRYADARPLFEEVLAAEPWNHDALLAMADLEYRRARYEDGLAHVRRALELDAYDAKANFVAGNLYRALGRTADARDAFGWAVRSMAYRSAAGVQLAELALARRDFDEAARYAELAVDYDRFSLPAWQVLAIIGRRSGDADRAGRASARLLEIDPLHHFVRAEAYLARPTVDRLSALTSALRSEYPGQEMLELAVAYARRGLADDATTLLDAAAGRHRTPVHRAWLAYLRDDTDLLSDEFDLGFVFPYRGETLPVLEWATQQSGRWEWEYLRALNLWALDRPDEARVSMARVGEAPDLAAFYVARAHLAGTGGGDPEPDLRRAVERDPGDRTIRIPLVRYYQDSGRWDDALAATADARGRFADDFNLQLLQARSLVHLGRPVEAVDILAAARVLPSENARESHQLYAQAHTMAALDAIDAARLDEARAHLEAALEWPEHLGQGRPYDPEERVIRYLLGRVHDRSGRAEEARRELEAVISASEAATGVSRLDLLTIAAAAALDRLQDVAPTLLQRAATVGPDNRARQLLEALSRIQAASAADVAAAFPDLFSDLEGGLLIRALSLAR